MGGLTQWFRTMYSDFGWKRDNRILIAITYCLSLSALGLCIASLGPALLELALQTNSTLTHAGYVFAVRSVGYLVGSFGGPLYDLVPGHLVMGSALLLAGLGSLCIPLSGNVYLLGFVVSFQGFAMGLLDTGANVMLIYQFGVDVGPWMQFMHASFAIGAFCGPLLLRASAEGAAASTSSVSSGGSGESGSACDGGSSGVDSQPISRRGLYDAAFYTIAAFCASLALAIFYMKSPAIRGTAGHHEGVIVDGKRQEMGAAAAGTTAIVDAGAGKGAGQEKKGVASLEDEAWGEPPASKGINGTNGGTEGAASNKNVIVEFAGKKGREGEEEEDSASKKASLASSTTATGGLASQDTLNVDDATFSSAGGAEAIVESSSSNSSGSTSSSVPPTPTSTAVTTAAANKTQKWKVIGIVAVLLGLYVGCETGFGAFVTAFDVVYLGASEAQGQYLAGAYWAAIMVGRLSAVPISIYMKPDKYLGISMLACVASMVLLLLGSGSTPMVWIGSILFGLSMACVFPTAVALAETYFPVSGMAATCFVVGSATGEWILPFIIATFFGDAPGEVGTCPTSDASSAPSSSAFNFGPMIMLWVVAIACALNMGAFYAFVREGRKLHAMLNTTR